MTQKKLAVVGAAESTQLGTIPDMSMLGIQADAALNALADAGLTLADIDGLACAEPPWSLAAYLGLTPNGWIRPIRAAARSWSTCAMLRRPLRRAIAPMC